MRGSNLLALLAGIISICWLPIRFWFPAILHLFNIVCTDPLQLELTPLKSKWVHGRTLAACVNVELICMLDVGEWGYNDS